MNTTTYPPARASWLFNTVPPDPAEAAWRFKVLVNRCRFDKGCGFTAAWEQTQREHPEMFLRAKQARGVPPAAVAQFREDSFREARVTQLYLFNRASDTVTLDQLRDLSERAFDALAPLREQGLSELPVHKTPVLISNLFWSKMRDAQQKLGLNFDQGWQFMQDSYPELFAHFCVITLDAQNAPGH